MQETCKMKSRIKVDRISALPKNIIDSILTRLTIKEAVCTSILSRSWRCQWHSLSKININYIDILPLSQVAFVNMIDHILLVHCGSIDTFKLNIYFETCNDIDRWILYVSRNGIKELIIKKWNGMHYNLPSCLFSCSDLTRLNLTRGRFKLPLAAFKAFSNLRELFFHEVIITDKVLENLINSCPLLSILTLVAVKPPPSLKINAPKLVVFDITNFNHCPQFLNTPLLYSASFGSVHIVASVVNENCKIVEFFGSMPILWRLELDRFAFRHLAVGDVPARLPLICHIKQFQVCINFEDMQELLAAFCIFRSSPFIQRLELRVILDKNTSRISADGFWKGEHDFSFRFDHLQEVEVYYCTGTESELKFIEFLLSKAPALKTMNIDFELDAEDELTTVKKLIRFPRISPKAELILPTYYDQ